jgi:hypothetical protein
MKRKMFLLLDGIWYWIVPKLLTDSGRLGHCFVIVA